MKRACVLHIDPKCIFIPLPIPHKRTGSNEPWHYYMYIPCPCTIEDVKVSQKKIWA